MLDFNQLRNEQTNGCFAGIAALGRDYICVGIHTGTILVFEVVTDEHGQFLCRVIDSQRNHAAPISDLASTSISKNKDFSEVRKYVNFPAPQITGRFFSQGSCLRR